MGKPCQTGSAPSLYDEDFVAWAEQTAWLLRQGRLHELDIENLAEEIEAMANQDRRELLSRLTVLLHHLLKWGWQPEKRSGSWKLTIGSQRAEIEQLLEESPSLRSSVTSLLPRAYRNAVRNAADETGLPEDTFPRDCPFPISQALDRDFLPQP